MQSNKLIPELYCMSIKRSLRFYTEVLGFSIHYARPEERFAFLEREGAQLMIEQSIDPTRTWLAGELKHPYGRGINLQIEVTDIEALHAAVKAGNHPIFLPLEDRWYRCDRMLTGNRQFGVQDPDGYLLRFFQDLGTIPA